MSTLDLILVNTLFQTRQVACLFIMAEPSSDPWFTPEVNSPDSLDAQEVSRIETVLTDTDYSVPPEENPYIPHMKGKDEAEQLQAYIPKYQEFLLTHPEGQKVYNHITVDYVRTTVIRIKEIQKPGKKNGGRVVGITAKTYNKTCILMDPGFNTTCCNPGMLEGCDYLLNGNHRLRWYRENGHLYILIDIFRLKKGFTKRDAEREFGTIVQPQVTGNEVAYEDFKRQLTLDLDVWNSETSVVNGEEVPRYSVTEIKNKCKEWAEKWVRNQLTNQQKVSLISNSVKASQGGDINSISTLDFEDMLKDKGCSVKNVFTVGRKWSLWDINHLRTMKCKLPLGADGVPEIHRYFNAKEKVFHRDVTGPAILAAEVGIRTVLHLYTTTGAGINTPLDIVRVIQDRMDELNGIFDSICRGTGTTHYRNLIRFGYRAPQICDYDLTETLVDLENEELGDVELYLGTKDHVDPVCITKLEQTYNILDENFAKGVPFSFKEAEKFIYPERTKVSDFKNYKSFKGTILSEFQTLRTRGYLKFEDDQGCSGWYTLL